MVASLPNALPGMPPVAFTAVNGLRLAYYEVARSARDIPVIFCHGFPELAFSWRHQLRAFASAGRWAVAPDQRGFGLTGGPGTGAPDAVEAYDVEHLASDLVGLLDHLGAEKAIWCGHDWGGIVAWQMPLLHPDRTAGVIGINTPFHPPGRHDPIDLLRARHGETMYVVEFQQPDVADAILNRDPRRTIEFFLRHDAFDPAVDRGCNVWDLAQAPFVRMLDVYDPARDQRPRVLDDEELDVFAEAFERTGFTGGINWYRNLSRNWRTAGRLPRSIDVPALMVAAEKDPILPPSFTTGMESYIPDLEKALVPDSGHWTQQERPEEVTRILIDWLDRRFPLEAAL